MATCVTSGRICDGCMRCQDEDFALYHGNSDEESYDYDYDEDYVEI